MLVTWGQSGSALHALAVCIAVTDPSSAFVGHLAGRELPDVLRAHCPDVCANPFCDSTEFGPVCHTPCKVFRMTALVERTIEDRACLRCGHRYEFDGSEEFLLRKATIKSQTLGNFELCFDWVLLIDTLDDLVTGKHWSSRWAKLMKMCTDQGHGADDLAAMQLAYPHFRCGAPFADMLSQ